MPQIWVQPAMFARARALREEYIVWMDAPADPADPIRTPDRPHLDPIRTPFWTSPDDPKPTPRIHVHHMYTTRPFRRTTCRDATTPGDTETPRDVPRIHPIWGYVQTPTPDPTSPDPTSRHPQQRRPAVRYATETRPRSDRPKSSRAASHCMAVRAYLTFSSRSTKLGAARTGCRQTHPKAQQKRPRGPAASTAKAPRKPAREIAIPLDGRPFDLGDV